MNVLVNVDTYCSIAYGDGWDSTEKSKKSKRNTVSEMCRKGSLKARKHGKRWLIRLEDM